MVELWIVLVHAPNERWHRATFHGTGMASRLAITPRNCDHAARQGRTVHYWGQTRKETSSELPDRFCERGSLGELS
jgi:hypothetical protein